MRKVLMILWIILFFIFLSYPECIAQTPVQASKDKVLQYAKPKKPIKIKLHRDKKGEYSWDITGESVEDVIKADRRLRQLLKEE